MEKQSYRPILLINMELKPTLSTKKQYVKKRECKMTQLVSRMKSEYKIRKFIKAIHHIKLNAS